MKIRSRRALNAVIGAGVVSLAALGAPMAAHANEFTPNASATGLRVGLLTLHTSLSATGPEVNSSKTTDLVATPVGLPAYADALHSVANAVSRGNLSASTSAADVSVPGVLTASLVTSSANGVGNCDSPSVYSGAAFIDTLVVGGKPIPTNPVQPNTKYSLPGLITVVLNEQVATFNSITVRAIHVTGPLGLDVVVGESTVANAGCPIT